MALDRLNIEWKGSLASFSHSLSDVKNRLVAVISGESDGPGDGSSNLRFGESLHQRDTYYRSIDSRLKLREIRDVGAELIWYVRSNSNEVRRCQYRRLAVEHPTLVHEGLSATLGVETTVVKERLLFWWQNVRIHLDEVAELGEFIEFEAVLEGANQELEGERQLNTLLSWLGLDQTHAISSSYRELMIDHCRSL